ncbi:hypothetical protein A2U01_0099448, partial [Trifolium medium]|nr:hypothetical protein [Trifolium medium]
EVVTTSEKDKVVEEDTAGKEKVVVEEGKKKEKKRRSSSIKIDEGRSKLKHDKRSKKDDSCTESDEETIAQKLKQKT